MHVLFFVGDAGWTARARIFTAAAHGLAGRGHEVSIACPPGPVLDHLDTRAVGVVRLIPGAYAALETIDFRRVAQERSLDVVFVHSSREQFIVGSGMRLANGGRVLRRVSAFESAEHEPGLFTSRLAPATSFVAPLGVDVAAADATAPVERRALHLRDDAIIVACPYALNGRSRLLNMMRTVAQLGPRHPRLRAVIVGDRATHDDLRMQAAALGVAPLVQFVDAATADPVSIMKASDFVWVAADHDAGALGCLDAMGAARSIVAERSPTIESYVADGINGTVLSDREPAAVAAAVASVIGRADVRATQGRAGRARAERELTVGSMIDGFERVLQASPPSVAAR
jgi:glycosyltransferase involved in cell wall biosynthesis